MVHLNHLIPYRVLKINIGLKDKGKIDIVGPLGSFYRHLGSEKGLY